MLMVRLQSLPIHNQKQELVKEETSSLNPTIKRASFKKQKLEVMFKAGNEEKVNHSYKCYCY